MLPCSLHLVWVFAGDAGGDHMTARGGGGGQPLKVDEGVAPRLDPVQHPDVLHAVEGDPHGDLDTHTHTHTHTFQLG